MHGGSAIGIIGGARLANEDAYAWSKLARAVLGTDNVDAQLGDGLPAETVLGLPRATIDQACHGVGRHPARARPQGGAPRPLPAAARRRVDDRLPLIELAEQRSGLSRYAAITLLHRPGEVHLLVRALMADADPDRRRGRRVVGRGGRGPPAVEKHWGK